MEKLRDVKFFNSVRLSNVENFFYHSEKVDITLDGIIVTLTDKQTKDTICTTLMNVICFHRASAIAQPEESKSSKK